MGQGAQSSSPNREIEKARSLAEKPACFQKIVLKREWKPIALFMSLIIIFSVFSTLFAAFFACFGEPEEGSTILKLDTVMEVFFFVDLVKNFFLEYTDPREPRKPVRDLYLIARNYIKGAFIFDMIACSGWPFR